MKYITSRYLFIGFTALILFACSEKEPIKGVSNQISIATTSISSISSDSAIGGGTISDDGGEVITERGLCFSINQTPTVNDNKAPSGSGKGSFTAMMKGLLPNTKYYVRAYTISSQGEVYGNEINFKTIIRIPTTTTINVTNITGSTATTGGQVVSDGGEAISDRGICWSSSKSQPTINDNRVSLGSGGNIFPINLSNLMANTTYWVRAYSVNTAGIGYGSAVSFRTGAATVPELSAVSITNVGRNTATASTTVNSNGGALLNTYGVCISTSSSMIPRVCNLTNGNILGSITVNLTSLVPGTVYYARAYATNTAGEGSSAAISSFMTLAPLPPVVSATSSSNVLLSTATILGIVSDDGGLPILETGFYIGRSTPTSSSTKVVSTSTGTGSYSANATGLTQGTTYYYRAYARNAVGTSLSANTLFFTTKKATPPTVIASSSSNILFSSASMFGNVSDDGGLPILETGFYIGLTTPTLSSTKVVSISTGIGSYSANATGLTQGTTYYYRAYARNAVGTSLSSNILSFTTKTATPPTVIASSSSNILFSSATLLGNVSDDGGLPILESGFYIGLSTPTLSSTKVVSLTTGPGSYSAMVSGLTSGTTYYFRAYARNSVNVSLSSNTLSFTTQQTTTPTVTTTQESNVMANTIVTGGNVINDGGVPITSRGVVWASFPGVNINNAVTVNSGIGGGSFVATLSGLTANKIIYFKAFARNASGFVGYGLERSVVTRMSTPALSSPISNAIVGCCTSWNFSWQTVSGASSYQIQISRDGTFASPTTNILQCGSASLLSISAVNVYGTNTASACVNAAPSNGKGFWYWRVRAISAANSSDWSSVRSINYR